MIKISKEQRLQVFFSVPKRLHPKATSRNLIKRRLMESFRRQKNSLWETLFKHQNATFHIGIIYKSRNIASFAELDNSLSKAFTLLQNRI